MGKPFPSILTIPSKRVASIDQFDHAYSMLHVVLMALESDSAISELSMLQLREVLSDAIEMLVPVRVAINEAHGA